jgi:hypothetical protein
VRLVVVAYRRCSTLTRLGKHPAGVAREAPEPVFVPAPTFQSFQAISLRQSLSVHTRTAATGNRFAGFATSFGRPL